jgi:transposase
MAETRRKFDQDFKEGAVRLVRETGKPVAQVAKDQRELMNGPGH